MATAHQVSVITNSCYKAPVSRQTVLPATGNDESTLGASWFGRDADYLDDNSNMRFSESVNFDTTNTMADTLNVVDLSELTDEEFYKRLSDLKSEHKKTLELCEKLYNDKLLESRTGTAPTDAQQVPVAVALVDADYVLTASRTHTGKDISSPSTDLSKSFDRVRDMSASKPPIARPSRSSGTPARSGSAKKQAWTRSNENFWKSPSTNSSDAEFSGNETERSKLDRSLEALNISRASYMSRIEDMWDNFSVDNYAPRDKHKVRPRSSSLSRISTSRSLKQDELSSSQQWRHRITVPSPFKMTLREANKMPKKTKAMLELEQKREEERRQEDAECQKKFKARPVPSHVYMPLFQEIMEEKESKRRYVQKASAEMLLSMQKPFKFDIREKEEKKFRRTHSTPCDTDINKKPPTSFKARPFPVRIFDDEIDERLREEEEYRKIRIQMRSEELLRSASLPPNMAAKGHEYTEGKLRHKIYAERAKKAGLTTEHKFKPTINGTVPDFEKKHKKVLVEAMKRKDQKEATVCKPFRLHSASLHKDYHKMSHGHFADENEMRHKSIFLVDISRLHSDKDDDGRSLEIKCNEVRKLCPHDKDFIGIDVLGMHMKKSKMQIERERKNKERERQHQRIEREKELRKYVNERALYNDNTCVLQNAAKEKLQQYKESDRERMMEYRRQLKEINNRVKQRPLLFEKTMQDNAKHRAEKKYKETLSRAGVDEDFISSKGRSTDNDDFDLDSESPRYATDPVSHSYSMSGSRRYSYGGSASDRTTDNEDQLEEEIAEEE
ncbi:hypothetical protein LSH36_635g01004 [Paralvinella palmiformis]|uniref:Uncharacterized protein n=1 Tax=Paralvinella palmiformis TaxID=53620 RepID=A0AAD9J3Q2_9ANNE|nr:hypothetical protein LSH36_635g01004 [Paralvinella palmiformis]